MLYSQHRFVGDQVSVGKNAKIVRVPSAAGKIVFTRREKIHDTSERLYKDLAGYNPNVAKLSLGQFRYKVELGTLTVTVRRSFGEVNAWAGDHAKLSPPDGNVHKFEQLKFNLQNVVNIHDIEYLALAIRNWDHFMPMSYRTWWLFHKEALRLARQHHRTRDNKLGFTKTTQGRQNLLLFDLDKSDLAKALFLDAYGCHFLEDCFASGHLRTPRLLFGTDPVDALRSKKMHDEDNTRRLEGSAANGHVFRLIGEDGKRDDFRKAAQDPVIKRLLQEVTATVALSAEQVLNAAFPDPANPKPLRYKAIGERIPRVDIGWRKLAKDRRHTHSLEIWPTAGVSDIPRPLYKIHASYNPKKKRFEDPDIIKRSKRNRWRKVGLSDVDGFTPGKGLAWWIPDSPDKTLTIP
jgi:hypothetical protein